MVWQPVSGRRTGGGDGGHEREHTERLRPATATRATHTQAGQAIEKAAAAVPSRAHLQLSRRASGRCVQNDRDGAIDGAVGGGRRGGRERR